MAHQQSFFDYANKRHQESHAVGKGAVIAKENSHGWLISGDTYTHRITLREAGANWLHSETAWFVIGALPDAIKAIIEQWEYLPKPTQATPPPAGKPTAKQRKRVKAITRSKTQAGGAKTAEWFVKPSWWSQILLYIEHRPAVAIVGPAGNGKTTAVEQALTAQNMPFLSLSCTDRTEVLDLVGGMVLTASGEAWRDGIVTTAFRTGQAVVLDEADTLDPRVMMALQNALQDGGVDGKARYVNTPDGRVHPTQKCPILMCMNTTGGGSTRQYNGRNKLDGASLDRLSYIATDYENETLILARRGCSAFVSSMICTWAGQMRSKIDEAGLSVTLSPRTLLRIAQSMSVFQWTFNKAIGCEFLSRLSAEQREVLA